MYTSQGEETTKRLWEEAINELSTFDVERLLDQSQWSVIRGSTA